MNRVFYKLSDLIIKKINKPGKYGDGNNLYLVVNHSKSKRWLLRIMVNGKRRDMGLGSAFNFNIKEAREVKVKNLLFLFWVQTIMFISKINKPNNAPLVL